MTNSGTELSLFDMIALAQTGVTIPTRSQIKTIVHPDAPSSQLASVAPGVTGLDAVYNAPLRTLASGWKTRALDNLGAIRLAREIVASGRVRTLDEAQILLRYVGFGATELAQSLFPVGSNPIRAGWEEIAAEFDALINGDERTAIMRSTQYAHFTPDYMTRGIWDAVVRLGFTGGGVVEPGCGIGLFIEAAPTDVPMKWIAIEIDPTTANIAKALHPTARIVNDDFKRINLQTPADLVIGNPPFSATTIQRAEGKAGKLSLRLHDYFIARSLELLRPGGLAAFVTSAGTMDKSHQKAREYMGSLAELIGAVRLPQAAMMAQAGTEVVVDVLFMRRLAKGESGNAASWVDLLEVTPPVANPEKAMFVNRYFAEHPEMVLGEHTWVTSPFGPKYSCKNPEAKSIESAFIAALALIAPGESPSTQAVAFPAPTIAISTPVEAPAASAIAETQTPVPAADGPHVAVESLPDFPSDNVVPLVSKPSPLAKDHAQRLTANELLLDADAYKLKEGTYCLVNGKLAQYGDYGFTPVAIKSGRGTAGIFQKHANIIQAFIAVRNALRAVIVAQSEDQPYEEAQVRLRKAYAAFVVDFGPINMTIISTSVDPETGDESETHRRPNIAPFLDDPDCWLVASIETYDIEENTAETGPIFWNRVVRPLAVASIDGPDDALASTLDEIGRVDIDHIAGLLRVTREEAISQLGDRIYAVPNSDDAWQTADEYLSGPVRAKLAIARESAAEDGTFSRNVEALETAQPRDLNPSEITARLGSPWIPVETIIQFVRELMDIEAEITHDVGVASWNVEERYFSYRPSATSEWGTKRRHAGQLLSDALNSRIPQIHDTEVSYDGKKTSVLNPVETEAAQEKLRKIKDAFTEWIWKDIDRATILTRAYNDVYNDIVPRSFDGSHLRLRNAASNINLYPHQKRAIWRIIASGMTYIAHSVGAGKSYSIAAAVMEQRRLGLVTKPLIAVPGHCLAQFSREFLQMYPTANLLVADEANFVKDKRQRFIARATTGDWDCIIITHSAFKFIPAPTEFEQRMIEDQVASIEQMLDTKPEGQTRKKLEQRKEALKERFEALKGRKDNMVTIAEMGIDQIIVDEAQNFRKLSFLTNTRNIKGIDSDGSQRAWDLYVKSKFVSTRRPGRALILASGTPITNTLGELFTIQRYMDEPALHDKNIHEFDAWSSMFGETSTELELQASGKYKPVTRFCEFINVPELVAMFRTFADVVQRHDLRDLITLPKIATGGRQIVTAEATRAFKAYQKELGNRIDEIEKRKGPPQPGDDIILSVITDGRHAAIDMRLVDRGAENEETNKLNRMIENVYRIYSETRHNVYHEKDGSVSSVTGAVQMIFSDLGTVAVKKTRGFSAYEWIKERLIRLGVPAREVAYMQDYNTSNKKQALFNALNGGRMRILMGSSETMGTGVNAQRRLIALHHLDVPWLPSQIEQREGRIERQGNENPEVQIYAYATTGSMDAPMWQTNERKSVFITMAMSGDRSVRRLEDASAQSNSFAIAKAIASGNPKLMQQAGLSAEIARLKRLKSAHLDDQHSLRYGIMGSKDAIRFAQERIQSFQEDILRVVDTSDEKFRMNVFGIDVTDRNDAGAYLDAKVSRLERTKDGEIIGQLGGFAIMGRAQADYITNSSKYQYGVAFLDGTIWGRDVGEVKGVTLVKDLEATIRSIPQLIEQNDQLISISRRKLADAEPRAGGEFEHAAELEAKIADLAIIEAELVEESRIAEEERRKEHEAEQAALAEKRRIQAEAEAKAKEQTETNQANAAEPRSPIVISYDDDDDQTDEDAA